MALLEVMNVGIAFGGLQAVAQLDMKIEKGHLYGLIGPTVRARPPYSTCLPACTVPPRAISFWMAKISPVRHRPRSIRPALPRTFQNIRLFSQMTVLDNVKIGLHNQVKYSMWTGIFRLPGFREKEQEMDYKAMKLLKIFDLDKEANLPASSLPYGKRRRWRLPVRWPPIPSCCCWTNPLPV